MLYCYNYGTQFFITGAVAGMIYTIGSTIPSSLVGFRTGAELSEFMWVRALALTCTCHSPGLCRATWSCGGWKGHWLISRVSMWVVTGGTPQGWWVWLVLSVALLCYRHQHPRESFVLPLPIDSTHNSQRWRRAVMAGIDVSARMGVAVG